MRFAAALLYACWSPTPFQPLLLHDRRADTKCPTYDYPLQWANECYCGNSFGSQGTASGCTDCAIGENTCGGNNAVYTVGGPTGGGPLQTEHRNISVRVFVDGNETASLTRSAKACGDTACPAAFTAVGAGQSGASPFLLPIYQLRVHSGLIEPLESHSSGSSFVPLQHNAANSRWLSISRGADGIEMDWEAVGWESAVHEHVRLSLDPTGNLLLFSRNVSKLWVIQPHEIFFCLYVLYSAEGDPTVQLNNLHSQCN